MEDEREGDLVGVVAGGIHGIVAQQELGAQVARERDALGLGGGDDLVVHVDGLRVHGAREHAVVVVVRGARGQRALGLGGIHLARDGLVAAGILLRAGVRRAVLVERVLRGERQRDDRRGRVLHGERASGNEGTEDGLHVGGEIDKRKWEAGRH